MKIWWCQEHDTFSRIEDCWWRGTWEPKPCRLVPMRLIPDNEETVRRVAQVLAENNFNHDCTHNHILEAVAVLAALDGETP